MKTIEGKLEAKGIKFSIIVSRFNNFISERLLEGAIDTLVRHGADQKDITVVRVPGSFEIPIALRRVVEGAAPDAVICLGALIRGATPHFDYIASEVTKGIANISIDSKIPVAYGIITADTIEQAVERAGTKQGNKGTDAAISAIEMANLFKQL